MLCQNELNASFDIVRNHVAERLGASMSRFAFKTRCLWMKKRRDAASAKFTLRTVNQINDRWR